MPNAADIQWFKEEFGARIEAAIAGTPFSLDFITAMACRETGTIWPVLRRKNLGTARLLELCVGDTLDASGGRRAFPRTRAELLARPNGERMFAIARQALLELAEHIPAYEAVARRPGKFCHGFGIFQYDLQHFLVDPDYFLEKRHADFDACLARCLGSLGDALRALAWQGRTSLTDVEAACVAIAYNTGGYRPAKGLKQGHRDADGRYYGENVLDFIRLSQAVAARGGGAARPAPRPGTAPLAPPTPVAAAGPHYEVEVLESTLNLRREPRVDRARRNANVIASLPDGHLVRALSNRAVNGFLEVETTLAGAYFRGYAYARYLKPAAGTPGLAAAAPAARPPAEGIVAVHMPRRTGTVTRRTAIAGAHSLNEPGQPARRGGTPAALCAELAAIIAWLAVDRPSHLRYQPRGGMIFCNVYAHDYCHLAGAYLPRVWWGAGAIERLARGETVEPRYGETIDEQRANDLFRWLRDFGLRFGWRRTGALARLQVEVNAGAIGLVVARRTQDGRPGHVSVVVPETGARRARRDAAGVVLAPLQSQAGSTNFRYGTGRTGWWLAAGFAESGFWLHA
ncbi:MAG: hypothetical protein IT529_10310 [Burkholderiales bacterium]|nr:hypothetical protein [Burkholderiales bacterium]